MSKNNECKDHRDAYQLILFTSGRNVHVSDYPLVEAPMPSPPEHLEAIGVGNAPG
jgi:hypothetical protein